MKRWHQDVVVALRQKGVHFRFVHNGMPTGCACDEQVGRFRKQRGMGCGRARCQLCHFDKIHRIKSHHDRVSDLRFREQLAARG